MFLRGYVEKILYIKGSEVTGENINLIAKGNVNVEAAANTSTFESKDTKSGSQIGVSFSVNGMSAYGYAYGSKEKGDGTTVTWTGSNVKASDTLNIETGKDTNIIGSKVSGDKVNMNVGGDLNIQSLQDVDNQKYDSSNYGISGSIGFSGSIDGKGGLNVSGSKNKINSEYSSVTDQAGIYAGNRGFDINVANNTDLKGAVIDSTATGDKNTLITGTITFDDIKNKAEYDSSGYGFSYSGERNKDKKEQNILKQGDIGFIPNIPMGSSDEDSSTTKSAIADGTIVLTKASEQKQDVTQLNRNTQDTLNKLDKIFDKKEIEEKQELAGLFAELSFNAIHDLSATKKDKDGNVIKQGWSEEQKVLAHAAVGYISAELAGSKSSFSTALAAGVNKFVTEEILKDEKALAHYKEHPEELQWLSAALGATIGQMAGDAGSGASIAASATKNNRLNMTEKQYYEGKDKFVQEFVAIYGDTEENRAIAEQTYINEKWNESVDNDKKVYGKINTKDGYYTNAQNIVSLNADKEVILDEDGDPLKGYAPEYGKVISFNNTFVQTGEGHQSTSMGTMSYPTGYYVLTDDKLVMDAKDKLGIGVTGAILGSLYTPAAIGVLALDGLSYLATNKNEDLASGITDVGLWRLGKTISSKFINSVIGSAVEVGKYHIDNNKGVIKYPSSENEGGKK